MDLHLNKLESHSPKEVLCQVWLKLAQWFWRRRFFNFVNVFSLSPLGKGRGSTTPMTTTTTTDNGQILIRKAHLSLWQDKNNLVYRILCHAVYIE